MLTVEECRFFNTILNSVIPDETCILLDSTQRKIVVSYRRFGTTYRSRLQGSRIQTGPICCPETSVRYYHSSLRNNPEERSSHLLSGTSLKSATSIIRVMLCYVMLCHVMSCYVMLCHDVSCYVVLCYVMLRFLYSNILSEDAA